jgi:hypothetical protein
MGTIGGTACSIIRVAGPPGATETVRSWNVLGQSGTAYALLGYRAKPFQVEAIAYIDTLVNALQWYVNMENKVGSYVSIVDDHGTTFNFCMVKDIRRRPHRVIISPHGNYLCSVVFDMDRNATS